MSIPVILLAGLLLLLVSSLPAWPHSHDWGYTPSAIVGLLAVALITMMLLEMI